VCAAAPDSLKQTNLDLAAPTCGVAPKRNLKMTWSDATNILCIRLDQLGDVLMTTPALRALREAKPTRRLTLLTSPAATPVVRLVPDIDDALVFDAPWMKATAPRLDSRRDREMIERLRRRAFDAAVIFTVYSQNPLPAALLCYLADIPLRLAHCHENPYQLLTDWIPDPDPRDGIRHEVRRQLELVSTIGARTKDERLRVRISEAARKRVAALIGAMALDDGRPWLVIHSGASAPSRRYPPELFAEAARQLVVEGCGVLFTGSASERELIDEVQRLMEVPSRSLAGRLDLEELAALIARAPLLIANNTGPVHLAAAVGTPVVDLYALTNPQHTPWMVPSRVLSHDVPCKYCYKSICPEGHNDCLRRVPPEAVVAAALELLEERRADLVRALAASDSGGPGGPPYRRILHTI
jgi:lipopolysaccharide heptosyltransferase II